MFRTLLVLTIACLVLSACTPTALPPPPPLPANAPAPAVAQAAPAAPPPAALDAATTAALDAYITTQQTANNVPGLAVGIVKDGQLVYEKDLGVANVDTGRPVTPQTIFRLSDVTTIVTTIAVLQLAEQGKLDLDAPVLTYLPYFKLLDPRYKDITVREILENRSGMSDANDVAQMWKTYPVQTDAGAVERYVRGMDKISDLFTPTLHFDPGTSFEHTYIAPIVLGDIVQKVSGEVFEDYVRAHIFAPLGMKNSTLLLDEVDPAQLASPHVMKGGKVAVSSLVPFSREFASSDNLYSNVPDMARLLAALLNGGELDGARILSPASVVAMMTRSGSTDPNLSGWETGIEHPVKIYQEYGEGGFLGEIDGHKVYHMDGWQHGYRADVMLAPDQNLAIILLGDRGQNELVGYASDELYANNMVPDVMSILLDVN